MGRTAEIVSLHIWLAAWIALMAAFVWGDLAERSYAWRMRSRRVRFLMPGRWAHRRFYVSWMKRIGGLGLALGLLVYALALSSILSES